MEQVSSFFHAIWTFIHSKHQEGVYNTVCLAVLMALPALVLLASLFVCCHCCFCGRRQRDGRGSRRSSSSSPSQWKKRGRMLRKKKEEDLWISAQPKMFLLEKRPSLLA
ncbi:hypothetical protein EYD10_12153 [Varanus komodoensis]|uniref:KIAA0040 n=1 Tax=Varanus komodoensis TaxID=61221 RepID=A0A8D2Q483_VARKO|nr:uncharacterized protein KIAA0040 homolog [Varanus komodoensis]KAF7241318.1 hypothetical protein EYD10_12153 [Varanus komodoensis]